PGGASPAVRSVASCVMADLPAPVQAILRRTARVGWSSMTEHASIVAPTDSAELDVSIILPVYNEVEHLKQEVDRIRAAMDASDYSYEIIVVDDGSSDGSGQVAEAIGGLRVIRFLQNRGSGSARKAGTAAARFEPMSPVRTFAISHPASRASPP